MKNPKKLVYCSLLTPILCGSAHKIDARFMDHFKDMMQAQQKMIQEMETQFNDFAQEFDDMLTHADDQTKQPENHKDALDMNVSEDVHNVMITFKNIDIDSDKIESPVQDDRLDISIPFKDQTIKLHIAKHPQDDFHVLTVETKHEAKAEKTKEDKGQASYYSYSSSQMQQMLPALVNLENSEIEYNQAEKQLIVKLPKRATKRITVVKK